jgi:hypothetical protein
MLFSASVRRQIGLPLQVLKVFAAGTPPGPTIPSVGQFWKLSFMAGTDFKDGWTIQLVEIAEAGPASRAHHFSAFPVSFTHECSRLIHVYRWPIIGQRSLDGRALTAEHRRSDRGEQTPPHDPSPCLRCSYAAVCRRLIRCRDAPVCIAPSRDHQSVQGAPDRAGLLLHRLHMLHYANYRFFFFAKITFQLSL